MIPCRMLGLCAAVGVVFLTAAFVSQDKGKDPKSKPAAAPAAEDPMMAKWAELMTPGPDHKVLDQLVGKWTTHVKFWMEPSGDANESDGTGEIKWIMGGRYLQENHKGTMMGEPFEGMGLTGFDNLKKKYVGIWIDNYSTAIMISEGTYDSAKKAFNYASQGPDPTMTKYVPTRMVNTFVDANTYKMEMYGPDASGKEYRNMEITYTRSK